MRKTTNENCRFLLFKTTFTASPEEYRAESSDLAIWGNALAAILVFVVLILCARFAPQWTAYWIVREPFGAIEMAGFILPLGTMLLALRMLATKVVRSDWFLTLWMVLLALGSLYIAGEEVSWGQWFWKWNTPAYWQGLNDQGETNLHNISNLFDQLPRAVLIIGISISGIVFPWFILHRPDLVMRRFDTVYPPLSLLPLAVAVLATDLLLEPEMPFIGQQVGLLRAGELNELYIFWFLFAYAIALRRRVRVLEQARQAAPPAPDRDPQATA